MKRNNMNLQDLFLNHVRKERMVITIYLVNGYQLKGTVRGFDNYTIIIENDNRQQMVYKHAISTISPSKQMDFQNIAPSNGE